MAGFDERPLYNAERYFADDDGNDLDDRLTQYRNAKTAFKSFLREFKSTSDVNVEPRYIYRDQLKAHYMSGDYWIDVDLDHLRLWDEAVAFQLKEKPNFFMNVLEEAAKEVADELTAPRGIGQEFVQPIQVALHSNDNCVSIRSLSSNQVSHIVKLSGIVVGASQVRSKATSLTIQCTNCGDKQTNIDLKAGFDGFQFPRQCNNVNNAAASGARCPIDPYIMVADECRCIDFQTLKLQENNDDVPHGEMPRHMQLFADRYLTDRVAPGNRVSIVGIYSIKSVNTNKTRGNQTNFANVRIPYIRVLGLTGETNEADAIGTRFTAEEIHSFQTFRNKYANHPLDIYNKIVASIAPSIYGAEDIKKAVACLLFGGSRKRLPDGLWRRGDINVLLLGDPGTAKSQLLKFTHKCAPIGVYTSGKGSSAAGLTAAVIRDASTRGFIMEGGAMVLADGGVVCIDEFDKMREDDRVAIHEAMEQQTISIAKAGITTTLNSRCSVLAAANSVFGRWDDNRGDENIDFMPTILSRFDTIFIVKDEHDEHRDTTLAKHVIKIHVDAGNPRITKTQDDNAELSIEWLRRYIAYARSHVAPRLQAEPGKKLISHYVCMRNPTNTEQENIAPGKKHKRSVIPISVRQLESIVRIAESIAKMRLDAFVTNVDVDEALRLFRVSTLQAAQTGHLAGVEGFTTAADQESMNRIEKQIKQRFSIGTQVAENVIVGDLVRQNYSGSMVSRVIGAMIRRGELEHKYQRRMLFRIR